MPLVFDSMAPQHSTPNVGGGKFRDNSEKKYTFRILVVSKNGVVRFKFYVLGDDALIS